jgi:two-component system, chemotaxis family, CheB/CheR fusion protein
LQTINAKHKLFRRKAPCRCRSWNAGARRCSRRRRSARRPVGQVASRRSEASVAESGVTALLSLYAPPAIVVNHQHEAMHLYGDVNPYLQTREGAASLEVSRLLPEKLTPVAAALLYKATRDRCSIVSDLLDATLKSGEQRTIRLSAHPLHSESDERLTLLCFEAAPNQTATANCRAGRRRCRDHGARRSNASWPPPARACRPPSRSWRPPTRSLQATNEELMASNEELQSSNEELQSVNEELSTVNAEFQEKMRSSTAPTPTSTAWPRPPAWPPCLSTGLHITRFSPDATQIFKLRETDLGRRLDDIWPTC